MWFENWITFWLQWEFAQSEDSYVPFPSARRGFSNWPCLGGDHRRRCNFHGLLPASLPRAFAHTVNTVASLHFTSYRVRNGRYHWLCQKPLWHTWSVNAWTKDIVLGPGFACRTCTVTRRKCLLTVWQVSPASTKFSIAWIHSFSPLWNNMLTFLIIMVPRHHVVQ